jgi:uncharacterized protein
MLRIVRWVMFVAVLAVAGPAMRGETVAGLPAPTGYVNDFAGVLTPETRQSLEDLCTQLDQQAHAQIAVVTVKSMDPDKAGATPSIEEFATALEDKWKVGKKGTDRGLLVIVSLNPRTYRIEVGYGLEGLLNDAKVGDIGRDMQPYLHTDDYNQGISLATHELAQDIAADAGVSLGQEAGGQPVPRYSGGQGQASPFPALLFGGIVLVVIAILIGTGHIGLLFFLLFNLLAGGRGGGGFSGGGFGGGLGGGGEGGGGGFGGGSSGGGGASGSF